MAAPFPSPTSKWHTETYPSLSPTRPQLSAKGKAILISGGGSGIGAATAHAFAEAGAARIALLGRREQPLQDTRASIEKTFPNVKVFIASTDVTNKAQVDDAFERFAGDGKIDVVVSNAALTGPSDAIAEANGDEWVGAVQKNLIGSVFVAQAVIKHASKTAVVIDVNSVAAVANFAPLYSSYSVAKLAVFRMWNHVGYTQPHIRVFHVQPGVVNTAMNREAGGIEAAGFEDHVSLPATFHVWLSSPEAEFLKGKYLFSNWDVDELKARAEELKSTPELSVGLVGWPWDAANASGPDLTSMKSNTGK